jgi:hypothetical protein
VVLRDCALSSIPFAAIALDAARRLAVVPLFGFDLRIMRRVVAGTNVPLPTWSDLGGIARDGLKLWVVTSLWMLPETTTRLLGDALASETGDDQPLALRGLVLLIGLVVLIVQPAAEVRLAATGSVGAGLDVRAAFRTVGRNFGGYLLLLVLGISALVIFSLALGLVWLAWSASGGQPSLVEVVTVGIATGPLIPYYRWVSAHLYGQAYRRAERTPTPSSSRRARRKGGPPTGPVHRPTPRPQRSRTGQRLSPRRRR